MTKNKYQYIRKDKGFFVNEYPKFIIKGFNLKPDVFTVKQRNTAFQNEFSCYIYFKRINWEWAPKLISYSKKERWLKLERINGNSFLDLILSNKFRKKNSFLIIKQLTKLNLSLSKNDINYCACSLKDVLLTKNSRIFLIDYESSRIEKYQGKFIADLIKDIIRRIFGRRIIKINLSMFKLLLILFFCFFYNLKTYFKGLKKCF